MDNKNVQSGKKPDTGTANAKNSKSGKNSKEQADSKND